MSEPQEREEVEGQPTATPVDPDTPQVEESPLPWPGAVDGRIKLELGKPDGESVEVLFRVPDLEDLAEVDQDFPALAIDESIEQGEEVPISNRHFKSALKDVKPTTFEWLTTARNHARYANEGGMYDEVLEFLDRYGKGK